ncbi:helix-turn-helix domain-containing protein [Altererythrobacter sp. MF3-039]|uniref:helix-turn-helix domain-containing protein n=1 Tax=Altererythrobacter sp. MF3-039 TaxID=3252901 RepID=UPI00390C9EE2
MGIHASFEHFTRAAFGADPCAMRNSGLEAIAAPMAIERGRAAMIERSRDQIVYLLSGATKLAAAVSDDREQIVAFHFPGDIISIPADGVHSYLLAALANTEILVFPAREFFDIAAGDEAMARRLFDVLPSALHRCRDKAVALGRQNAAERLAGFLIAMAERIGRLEGSGCIIELPMSRRDISDSLGLTIETVSRQLSHLREAGLVETQGRSQVAIPNLEMLTRCAGHYAA